MKSLPDFDKELEGPRPAAGRPQPVRYLAEGETFATRATYTCDRLGEALMVDGCHAWKRQRLAISRTIAWFFSGWSSLAFASADSGRQRAASVCTQRTLRDIQGRIDRLQDVTIVELGKGLPKLQLDGLAMASNNYSKKRPASLIRTIRKRQIDNRLVFTDYVICMAEPETDAAYLKEGLTPLLCTAFFENGLWTAPHIMLAKVSSYMPFWITHLHISLEPNTGETIGMATARRPRTVFLEHYPTYEHLFDDECR